MLDPDELIARYRRTDRTKTWVRANFVASLDGAATHGGRSGDLGDPEDLQLLRMLRQLADVVVVGAGTVRVEGYGGLGLDDAAVRWRRDHGLSEQPPLAIVSGALDLDPTAPAFTALGPRPLIITHGRADPIRRSRLADVADVLVCGDDALDPSAMISTLAARELHQLLCEGGPRLFGSLIAADVVDELCLSLSPRLEGGNAGRISRSDAERTRPMSLGHTIQGEQMLFLRSERARS